MNEADEPQPKPRLAESAADSDTRPSSDPDSPTSGLLEQRPDGDPAPGMQVAPGQILASRYRIVRFIARGGMGEVYQAEDLELHEQVALKTIRADIARRASVLERFKREIQLARKVAHRHVSRVFDLGLHRPSETEPPVAFLTMELLTGETLAERLRRDGRMLPAEALPILEQMVDGLAAAHRAGIVHRDLKSANVMLEPDPQGGVRVVVTDFGLAHAHDDATPLSTAAFVGTADYMAPEQVRGGLVTPAADIYALGVVIYEMLTGAMPFGGESPLSTAVKRLVEPPPSPRLRVPDLNPCWDAVIMRCLAIAPAARFASVTAVIEALRPPVLQSRMPGARLAIVLAVAVVAIGGVFVVRRGAIPVPAEDRGIARRSVAVLGFRNLSHRPESLWLSTALAEMLTTELAAGGRLRAIPGENIGRVKLEMSLPDAESLSQDTLKHLGANLDADLVLLGSYMLVPGGQLRLDLRLQDVQSGETLVALAENGTEANLVEMVTHAGMRLRRSINLEPPPLAEVGQATIGLPASLEAQRLYAEGLTRMRSLDALGAKELLLQATATDPTSPAAHAALAEAWAKLGYDARSKDEARHAFELSTHLEREQRLSIEASYRATAGEWDKAVDLYRALLAFFPDNVEYGLRLAAAQTWAGKGRDAASTIEKLRHQSAALSADPRIDLAEANVAQSLGDVKSEAALAARAATKGAARQASLLVAQARLLEAYALGRLGRGDEALQAAEAARSIYHAAGDRSGEAFAQDRMGSVSLQAGDLVRALQMYAQSLRVFEEIGYHGGLVTVLNNMGVALVLQGETARAKTLLGRASAIATEAGDRRVMLYALTNLGDALFEEGSMADARQAYERALAGGRDTGDATLVAIVDSRIADVMAATGEPGVAERYERALLTLRDAGAKRYRAAALCGFGELRAAQGDLAAARRLQEEALAVRAQLHDSFGAADSQLALARLAIDEGNAGKAEPLARSALAVFHAQQAIDREAWSYAVLALSLAATQPGEALASVKGAQSLAPQNATSPARLSTRLSVARAGRGLVLPAEALELARGVGRDAARLGLRRLQLEAELGLLELEGAGGQDGHARLGTLRDQATRYGYGLVALRTSALLAATDSAPHIP